MAISAAALFFGRGRRFFAAPRERYPHIAAILVLPYLDRAGDSSGYDGTVYPPLEKVPPRFAILRRNQWMVEAADVLISGVLYDWGGAAKTLDHARKKRKVIIQYPTRAK